MKPFKRSGHAVRVDPIVDRALSLLVPTDHINDRRDWRRVLDESRRISSQDKSKRVTNLSTVHKNVRRPILVSLLVVALVFAITIPALAVTDQWIFGSPGGPERTTPDFTVATGTTAEGVTWDLLAAMSTDNDLCMKVVVAGNGEIGGGCASSDQFVASGSTEAPKVLIGFQSTSFDNVTLIYGPAAVGVATVDLLLNTGNEIPATITPAPNGLGISGSFYVATIQEPNASVDSILAKSSSGDVEQKLSPNS